MVAGLWCESKEPDWQLAVDKIVGRRVGRAHVVIACGLSGRAGKLGWCMWLSFHVPEQALGSPDLCTKDETEH